MKKTSLSPAVFPNPVMHRNNKQKMGNQSGKLQHAVVPKKSAVEKSSSPVGLPGIHGRRSSYFRRLEQSDSGSSSLSRAEADDLTAKFTALSGSIVALARSRNTLGLRTLEALLSREITVTLGPALNHPAFSQGFIGATRTLLDNLVRDYESGKVSPRLIETDGNDVLQADSSTTLSYREKYFKELVINMLQILCSSNTNEEEIQKKVRSAESQERIQTIRNMVRAELGIAPDAFEELEWRIAELREFMFKITAEQGTDTLIAEPLDCLRIPRSARDALKTSCERRKASPSMETTRDINDLQDLTENRYTTDSGPSCQKNFNGTTHLRSPDDSENGGYTNTDNKCAVLRQELDKIVNDDFNRVDTKNKTLSERYSTDKCINPLESYPRKFDSELDNDSGDSINVEETRIFLEALRADKDKRNMLEILSDENSGAGSVDGNAANSLNIHTDISRINVLENRDNVEEAREFLVVHGSDMSIRSRQEIVRNEKVRVDGVDSYKTDGFKNFIQTDNSKINFLENHDTDDHDLVDNTGNTDEKIEDKNKNLPPCSLCSSCLFIVEEMWRDINAEDAVSDKIGEEPSYELAKTARIYGVKSRLWLNEASLAGEIMKEMHTEFDIFNLLTDDTFKQLKTVKNESKPLTEHLLKSTAKEQIDKYSVEEFADILSKISKHIRLLPITFDVENPGFLERRITQAFFILRVLDRRFENNDKNKLTGSDPMFLLNDKVKFSESITRVLLAFSNLAATINKFPSEIKNMHISVLDPPKTLIKIMAVLFKTDYFRDCFRLAETRWQKEDFKSFDFRKSICNLSKECPKMKVGEKKSEVMKCNIDIHTSGDKIYTVENQNLDCLENGNLKNPVTSVELAGGTSMGYSLSNVTMQNLSDMFLHISMTLNDVPESLKKAKFMTLNPPNSLSKAVSILYCSDSAEVIPEYLKKKSLASLTVQNTADVFLTLSSVFKNVPERVKNVAVKELDPPRSLKKAIGLLIYPSNSTIQEHFIQKTETYREKDESEHFFDAVDSIEQLKQVMA